jgi:hypothetical protein
VVLLLRGRALLGTPGLRVVHNSIRQAGAFTHSSTLRLDVRTF